MLRYLQVTVGKTYLLLLLFMAHIYGKISNKAQFFTTFSHPNIKLFSPITIYPMHLIIEGIVFLDFVSTF